MKSGEYRRPRFDAWPSACVAALWIALVALLGVAGRAGEDDSYYLTAWPYGAVAWVQTISLHVADFTDRLTRTAEYAFTFWGFKPPTPPKSWEHPEENPSKFSMTGSAADPQEGPLNRQDVAARSACVGG